MSKRSTSDYDLLVIGSGSAAMAAAIRARDWSRTVLLVERGTTGGTCVNVGCVPSKALLHDSERANGTRLSDAVVRKDALVGRLRQEKYVELIADYGIDYRAGEARVTSPHTISVDDEEIRGEAVLLAAGARADAPPIPGLADAGYLTSDSAIDLAEPPRRLAVIGANAIGLELGQMLGNFGSQVTFVDLAERIAPFEEPEVSAGLEKILEADGARVITSANIAEVAVDGDEKVLRGGAAGESLEVRADELLVATGRRPSTAGLGLEEAGVKLDSRGAVVVDDHQRTSVPSIYAAGDVTAQPQFVYVATAGGAAAASNALGLGEQTLDFDSLPRVTFTRPQIASAGLTESESRKRGFDVEVRVLGLEAVPRALVNGETRGLFKLVAESGTGHLLGASILAEAAGEVIQSAVLAIRAGMTVDDLTQAWAPYLTMAEGLKLAAQAFERDVARLSCCAA
ncbi:MAG: mercury(II) reductase [bacterium]